MAVTLKDIARQGNVSEATVSLVLRDGGRVGDETRERIREIAESMGYKPRKKNALASAAAVSSVRQRSSARARLRVAMLLWSRFSAQGFQDNVFPPKQSMMTEFFSTHNCTQLMHAIPEDCDVQEEIRYLKENRISGVVLVTPVPDRVLDYIDGEGIPSICAYTAEPQEAERRTMIASNSYDGAILAVQHLAALGHRRIGFLSVSLERRFALERRRGYQAALAEAGIALRGDYAVEEPSLVESVEVGERGMDRLLALDEPPTAVVAVADVLAAGAIHSCRRHGLSVPDDVSIIGFNNSIVAESVLPALTSVDLHNGRAGRLGAYEIYNAMTSPDYIPKKVLLPARLVERDSAAPPPQEEGSLVSGDKNTQEVYP